MTVRLTKVCAHLLISFHDWLPKDLPGLEVLLVLVEQLSKQLRLPSYVSLLILFQFFSFNGVRHLQNKVTTIRATTQGQYTQIHFTAHSFTMQLTPPANRLWL